MTERKHTERSVSAAISISVAGSGAWFLAVTAAVLCAGSAHATPLGSITLYDDGEAAGQLWRIAFLTAAVSSAVLTVVAIEHMLRTAPTDVGRKTFARGVAVLLVACALAIVAACVAGPARLWGELELVTRQDFFRNNFELPLLALGVALVALIDCIARGWARSKGGVDAPREASVVSIVAGCAIGSSLLVAIGSSAFAAGLWQREISVFIADDVSLERVQTTVDRIGTLDDETAAASEHRRLIADRKLVLETRSALYLARNKRLIGEIEALELLTPTDDTRRRLADLNVAADISALNAEEARAAASALASEVDELAVFVNGGNWRRACGVHELAGILEAEAQRPERTERTIAAPPFPARQVSPACQLTERVSPASRARAQSIIETAQPIRRSWMSAQLAKRTPVLLSIELVLLMGALGSLLRETARTLRRDRADGRKPRGALLALGLSVIFGTCTSFVFFVLMKATLTAALTETGSSPAPVNDLNPFTIALLGLAGGYASRDVLVWLGSVVRQSQDRDRRNAGAKQGEGSNVAGQTSENEAEASQ